MLIFIESNVGTAVWMFMLIGDCDHILSHFSHKIRICQQDDKRFYYERPSPVLSVGLDCGVAKETAS